MLKITTSLIALCASSLVVAQGGISIIGNGFLYHPTGKTSCGLAGSDKGLYMGVGQSFLNEFGCGHPVRLWSGTNTTVVPIGDLCPISLCRATDDIELTPAVFAALGQAAGTTVLVDMEWDP